MALVTSQASLPQFITFTGVDAWTDVAEMRELSSLYPIEWGVLFSPQRQGNDPRYPALEVVHRLVTQLPAAWSAHLCGSDARSVLEAGTSRVDQLLTEFFQRSQINTTDPSAEPSIIAQWAQTVDVRAILQCRDSFSRVSATDLLFDASGGRGLVPSNWPAAVFTTFCGYAGGLNPENVAAAASIIGTRAERYWIDMETGVRDELDRFSLSKCRAVCEAVYGPPKAVDGLLSAEELRVLDRVIEDFSDCGETEVAHEVLMGFAQRGYLECDRFTSTEKAHRALGR